MPVEPPVVPRCIVTVEEFIAYLGNPDLDVAQTADAASRLAGTQSKLELYLNRPIQPVRVRQMVQVDMDGFAYLYVSPIWTVNEVKYVDGTAAMNAPAVTLTALDVADPVVEQDWIKGNLAGEIPAIGSGGIYLGSAGWALVDYIGGYNGFVDEGLKDDIKRVTSRGFDVAHNDFISLQDSTASEGRKPDQRSPNWERDELEAWDRLRRRVVA